MVLAWNGVQYIGQMSLWLALWLCCQLEWLKGRYPGEVVSVSFVQPLVCKFCHRRLSGVEDLGESIVWLNPIDWACCNYIWLPHWKIYRKEWKTLDLILDSWRGGSNWHLSDASKSVVCWNPKGNLERERSYDFIACWCTWYRTMLPAWVQRAN